MAQFEGLEAEQMAIAEKVEAIITNLNILKNNNKVFSAD